MLVSIVIPVFNRAAVVARTLDSVLAQTHRPLQLVLVDNDSTDGTRAVLDRFAAAHDGRDGLAVVVDSAPHHMAGAPRNRGLELAAGEWVLFFDSDDEMKPRLVERYVAVIEKNGGNLDIVSTRATRVGADGAKRRLPFAKPSDAASLMPYQILNAQLATQRYAVRRAFFAATDGWNISLPVWNDWELGVRLLLARPRIAYLDKTLVTVHDSGGASITGTGFAGRAGLWEHVMDIARLNITLAGGLDEDTRRRWLRLIEFKRLTLAASYRREGRADLARPLCRKAYAALRDSYGNSLGWRWFKAPVTRWLFRRMARGARGSSHIARMMY